MQHQRKGVLTKCCIFLARDFRIFRLARKKNYSSQKCYIAYCKVCNAFKTNEKCKLFDISKTLSIKLRRTTANRLRFSTGHL